MEAVLKHVILSDMAKITDFLGFKDKNLKILFVSTEEAPFAKIGGLGEIMFSLPRALAYLGHDARVMIPFYGSIDRSKFNLPYVYQNLNVPTSPDRGGMRLICNVRRYEPAEFDWNPVITYFLENQEYYELRSNVYGYTDDHIRFALLSRGCLEFLNSWQEWIPDVIISTDWMTGYIPNFLKIEYQDYKLLKHIATVFSIHNLSSHGTEKSSRYLPESQRDDGHGPIPDFFSERMKDIDAIKRGIIYADMINTVSSTYAGEITTEEFGEGLENILREKRSKLCGILNGIDYETNDPATDGLLAAQFTSRKIEKRIENKLALQKKFGLAPGDNTFLVGIVSRLTRQKGFDLLEPIIDVFLNVTKGQLIAVGTGDTEIIDFFQSLEKKYPQQVRTHMQFDDSLPHLMFAGCDVFLIPSKFEPSGLTQMEAMRFGAVPVARKTGGLADTIEDFYPGKNQGTGFLFENMNSQEFLMALTRAFVNWRHVSEWKKLQKRVMEKDFSWNRSAHEYADLFRRAIASRAAEIGKGS